MVFWDNFLRKPPIEVNIPGDWRASPEDTHCVRWRGYEGGLEIDELWDFGKGMRTTGRMPLEVGFTKYGGETLCGIKIESGLNMYGPRWRSIEPVGSGSEPPDEDNQHAVLTDLYGITCMVYRNKLMYGISRLIEDLAFIRSSLVGDWVGEEYISREPLVHGKYVISSEQKDNIYSEVYQFQCKTAEEAINPQLVDDVKEAERITCQECLDNLAAGVIP